MQKLIFKKHTHTKTNKHHTIKSSVASYNAACSPAN